VDGEDHERQLNLHMEPQHLAGVYANFVAVSFSSYEFTLTFAGSTTRSRRERCRARSSRASTSRRAS
jgi:hypothetical protein